MFKLIRMYSDRLGQDAWWIEREKQLKGKPDYYGPWLSEVIAENNKRILINEEA